MEQVSSMPLISELENARSHEESPFRAQLLKEDISRLQKLTTIAAGTASLKLFKKEGLFIGWTGSDLHTHLIQSALETFLEQFYDYEKSDKGPEHEAAFRQAWATFNKVRMEKLIRCL